MTRIQIPAYTDRWMRGDRFGEIVKVTRGRRNAAKLGPRAALLTGERWPIAPREIAHVKLDKSGKTIRVILADCEVV